VRKTVTVFMKVVPMVVGTKTVLWTMMTPRVVVGISTVLVLVRWVVTVMSTVSVLVVVDVVVYRSVTVVVYPFSERVFTRRLGETEAITIRSRSNLLVAFKHSASKLIWLTG